ncbi:hypothetical protein RB195_012685 [Necator americanus]
MASQLFYDYPVLKPVEKLKNVLQQALKAAKDPVQTVRKISCLSHLSPTDLDRHVCQYVFCAMKSHALE